MGLLIIITTTIIIIIIILIICIFLKRGFHFVNFKKLKLVPQFKTSTYLILCGLESIRAHRLVYGCRLPLVVTVDSLPW